MYTCISPIHAANRSIFVAFLRYLLHGRRFSFSIRWHTEWCAYFRVPTICLVVRPRVVVGRYRLRSVELVRTVPAIWTNTFVRCHIWPAWIDVHDLLRRCGDPWTVTNRNTETVNWFELWNRNFFENGRLFPRQKLFAKPFAYRLLRERCRKMQSPETPKILEEICTEMFSQKLS